MQFDLAVEAPWPPFDWDTLAEQVADAVVAVDPELGNARLIADVLFTSDTHVRALNAQWRDKDRATNVLSFPMLERDEFLVLGETGPPVMLGAIALACETCAAEARDRGIALETHAAHLLVHGLLHLAGHDHETGPADAQAMERLEVRALARMGIADPYGGEA